MTGTEHSAEDCYICAQSQRDGYARTGHRPTKDPGYYEKGWNAALDAVIKAHDDADTYDWDRALILSLKR